MAAPLLADTDLLLTIPTIAMAGAAEVYGLDRREPPFELPELRLSLMRGAAGGDDPGVRWFLQRVAAVFVPEEPNGN